MAPARSAIIALALACACLSLVPAAARSKPAKTDGALTPPRYAEHQGHMLLLNGDAYVFANSLKNPPTDAITFEAWVRTNDDCGDGTLLSYSVDPDKYPGDDSTDNEFALFSTRQLMVCRGFRYYEEPRDDWLGPPLYHDSCASFYKSEPAFERRFTDNQWHHLAAVWTAANNGTAKIYKDGLLMSSVQTARTAPLRPGGIWVLGGEQDCFGGCIEPAQSFHGAVDDVRMWSVERSQDQILRSMLDTRDIRTGRDVHGLVGFWTFDDRPGSNVLADSGMLGNHLQLVRPPAFGVLVGTSDGGSELPHVAPVRPHDAHDKTPHASMAFDNTFALAPTAEGMPAGDFTVEMWVRTPALPDAAHTHQIPPLYALFSYAAERVDSSGRRQAFMDDAILLQLLNTGAYLDESGGRPVVKPLTANLDVWVNAASRAGAVHEEAEGISSLRLVFDTPALADGAWHHVAVTWKQASGLTRAYVDGDEALPIAGADATLARGSTRSTAGSVALGQDQDCPGVAGGCFSSSQALRGGLAEVRVWRTERSRQQIREALSWPWTAAAPADATPDVLAARWTFEAADRSLGCATADGVCTVRAVAPSSANIHLNVAAPSAVRTLSNAPHQPLSVDLPSFQKGIAEGDFKHAASSGHAIELSDQQVLINNAMRAFPSTSITVEFWMRSVDKCFKGTPISYATGEGKYAVNDNSFTLTDYSNWAIAVNEDQGHMLDTHAGVGSTTGDWQHVAVTWESVGGVTQLFLDGVLVWKTVRAPNTRIPPDGTLVIGREQDCRGGCFDSKRSASGVLDSAQEYGSQDFFGAIDEVRIWRVARSAADIRGTMETYSSAALAKHPDLIAYWTFDEGEGRMVRDVSGHGNDLVLTHEPKWVVSTIAEKKADREARMLPGDGDGDGGARPRKSKSRKLLTTLAVLASLAAAAAAFVFRDVVRDTASALFYITVASVRHVLASARRLMGRHPSSASYRQMDFADVGDVGDLDTAEAVPLTSYVPPSGHDLS